MRITRREKQIYIRSIMTFASNYIFIIFSVVGYKFDAFSLCIIGYIGIIFSLLYMFFLGHSLGWEHKRISIIDEETE